MAAAINLQRVSMMSVMAYLQMKAVRGLAPLAHHCYRNVLSKMNYYVKMNVNTN